MAIKFRQPVLIPIKDIHENEWNPNEQSEHTHKELKKEIEEDGFDQPIQVVPFKEHPLFKERPQYKIIGGAHRYRICRDAGEVNIPCIIYEDWDENAQKLKTVRRNLLTGDLNQAKFTKLVKDLSTTFSQEELAKLMGFEDKAELEKNLIKDMNKKEKEWLNSLSTQTTRETEAVDSISEILNTIFKDAGQDLDKHYMFFTAKGQLHLMILADDELFKLMNEMVVHLRSAEIDARDFMKGLLYNKLKNVGALESD